ncbi:MAG: phosphatase PAP2 family protein [Pyrinomonadaceae bacterium]|nr:phosphatase PAP2 family protein [Pyrinomonadaceae bacterium]
MNINNHDDETRQAAQQSPTIDLAARADSAQPQLSPRRRAAQRLLRAEIRYAAALAAFTLLAVFAHFYSYFGWDLRAERALQSLAIPGLEALMRFVSFFGNTWHPHAITAITLSLFLYFRRRSEAAALLLSAGGCAIVNSLAKILIARPRPTADLVRVFRDVPTQSFPSGHVTFYVCYFGFLFFTAYALLPRASSVRRLALAAFFLPVLLVGFSRVYLGAHWPSDTIGAYLLSGVWLAFSLHMYRHWKERATFHAKSDGQSTTG